MIRRELEFADGRYWLLVSQVEHAHVSGELVRHWKTEFAPEVVEAIRHHDDGWAAWEAEPKIDPKAGAPYSFLEMPLAESLAIWDASIAAARKFGSLAGYIVAGHFYSLLSESENAAAATAMAWLAAKRKVRTTWLDEWVRADPAHTLEYAKQAQQMLLLTDLFSLWLCCDCPLGGNEDSVLDDSPMRIRSEFLHGQFRFKVAAAGRRHPTFENPDEALAWVVEVDPYPLRTSPLSLSATALVAPMGPHTNWQGLRGVSRPIELRWRLIPATPSSSAAK
jgi:hypothetical protein